jgi:hypothetical protein
MPKNRNPVRRLVVLLAATLCAAVLAGCERTPAEQAQTYLSHLKQFDYHFCYRLLTRDARAERTFGQFLTEIPLAPQVSPAWFKQVLNVTKYAVGQARLDKGGLKAVVSVQVTAPDLPRWERTLDAKAGPEGVDEENAERALETGEYPTLTYMDSIVLAKNHDHWRVRVDFPAKDRIADMHRNALVPYHRHEYDNAVDTYRNMLTDLDKEQATGNEGLKFFYGRELKHIEKVIAEIPESQAYIQKLKLSDLAMKMSVSRTPAIFGTIANTGDRAIDEVEMTVTYYEGKDRDLRAVYSGRHIVIATPIEFTEFAEPVLPFVPGETRKFGFPLAAPAGVQRDGEPRVTVTSIAFTQSKAPLPKPPAAPAPASEASGGEANGNDGGPPAAAEPGPNH